MLAGGGIATETIDRAFFKNVQFGLMFAHLSGELLNGGRIETQRPIFAGFHLQGKVDGQFFTGRQHDPEPIDIAVA